MPFRTSLSLPERQPTVKIFFHGLLLLRTDEFGNHCDIGVHRSSPYHFLSIELREKHLDPAIPDVVLMRHLGPVEHPRFLISIKGGIDGVSKFIPTDEFDRTTSTSAGDFRWAIDLETNEFHGKKIDIDTYCTKPDIRVMEGIFYTALRTDETDHPIQRKGGGRPEADLPRIASIIGANLYGGQLRLEWTDYGKPGSLEPTMPAADSGKYLEIYINNNPPYTDLQEETHMEFPEYYKVIKNVPTPDQFTVAVPPPPAPVAGGPAPPNLTTPRVPCIPVVLGG